MLVAGCIVTVDWGCMNGAPCHLVVGITGDELDAFKLLYSCRDAVVVNNNGDKQFLLITSLFVIS